MTTNRDWTELRALAKAATCGKCQGSGVYPSSRNEVSRKCTDCWDGIDWRFPAACSPDRILSLLDTLDELAATTNEAVRQVEVMRKERDEARQDLEVRFADYHAATRRTCESLAAQLATAQAERDVAREGFEYLRRGIDGYDETFDAAYEKAGARVAHGEWYWPNADRAHRGGEGE